MSQRKRKSQEQVHDDLRQEKSIAEIASRAPNAKKSHVTQQEKSGLEKETDAKVVDKQATPQSTEVDGLEIIKNVKALMLERAKLKDEVELVTEFYHDELMKAFNELQAVKTNSKGAIQKEVIKQLTNQNKSQQEEFSKEKTRLEGLVEKLKQELTKRSDNSTTIQVKALREEKERLEEEARKLREEKAGYLIRPNALEDKLKKEKSINRTLLDRVDKYKQKVKELKVSLDDTRKWKDVNSKMLGMIERNLNTAEAQLQVAQNGSIAMGQGFATIVAYTLSLIHI